MNKSVYLLFGWLLATIIIAVRLSYCRGEVTRLNKYINEREVELREFYLHREKSRLFYINKLERKVDSLEANCD